MNKILLNWNSHSGKYSLRGEKIFLVDAYEYYPLLEEWRKVQEGSLSKPVVLKMEDCTKPTQKAIKALTQAIEGFYK